MGKMKIKITKLRIFRWVTLILLAICCCVTDLNIADLTIGVTIVFPLWLLSYFYDAYLHYKEGYKFGAIFSVAWLLFITLCTLLWYGVFS